MPESPTPFRLVLTSAGSSRQAGHLAQSLVEDRLAACVTVLRGAESVYLWKGQIESANESVLLIKTTEGQLEALEKRLKELHSYETPEFLVLKVEGGSADYLAWLQSSVGRPSEEN
jgi:periplasmic divalent cation tolerance protein